MRYILSCCCHWVNPEEVKAVRMKWSPFWRHNCSYQINGNIYGFVIRFHEDCKKLFFCVSFFKPREYERENSFSYSVSWEENLSEKQIFLSLWTAIENFLWMKMFLLSSFSYQRFLDQIRRGFKFVVKIS